MYFTFPRQDKNLNFVLKTITTNLQN